jgi:hypothetical protein
MQEVEKLKKDSSELKEKSKMQPSQDNLVNMVKKLEKGSTVISSAPQRHLKISKRKIQEKKKLEAIKCNECSNTRHFDSHCPTKLKAQETLSTKQISSIRRRLCLLTILNIVVEFMCVPNNEVMEMSEWGEESG